MEFHSRFLRKPWFVILENFTDQLEDYKEVLDKYSDTRLPDNAIPVSIHYVEGSEIEFKDPIEKEWSLEGFKPAKTHVKIQYKSFPEINHGFTSLICSLISVRAIISPGEERDYRKSMSDLDDRKVFRMMQDQINSVLRPKKQGNEYVFRDQTINVKYDFVLKLIDFAEHVLTKKGNKSSGSNDLECLSAIRDLLKSEFSSKPDKAAEEDVQYRKVREEHDKFWRAGSLCKKFHNTTWLCFQRTDGRKNQHANYGISISPVEIKYWGKDKVTANMICAYSDADGQVESYEYNGMVTADDNTENLIIELKRVEKDAVPASVAYFVMQLGKDKDQKVVLGYHMYYSLFSQRFITKVVIWEKLDDTKAHHRLPVNNHDVTDENILTPYARDINPLDDIQDFKNIPLLIRRFLSDRKLNRLTLPSKTISQLELKENSLKKWIEPKYNKADDQILKACCGKYHLFYYYGERIYENMEEGDILEFIRVDELSISFDENFANFSATYVHERNRGITYHGKADRKSTTIEVLVEYKGGEKYKTTNVNMILISFSIPNSDEHVFEQEYIRYSSFEGLISGLNDNELTPVAFLALIKKMPPDNKDYGGLIYNKKDPENAVSGELIDFFKKNRKQLKIEVAPFVNKNFDYLVSSLAEKNYPCAYDPELQIFIIYNKGKKDGILYQSPKKMGTYKQALQEAELFIRKLKA